MFSAWMILVHTLKHIKEYSPARVIIVHTDFLADYSLLFLNGLLDKFHVFHRGIQRRRLLLFNFRRRIEKSSSGTRQNYLLLSRKAQMRRCKQETQYSAMERILCSILRYSGGLAIYGGLIGAVLFGAVMARIRKVRLMPMLDFSFF